jgi:hypothetical protein
MKPDKKYKDLDPKGGKEALEWFQHCIEGVWRKTKDECRTALRKSNALCCWSNGAWRVSSSGYLDAIRTF